MSSSSGNSNNGGMGIVTVLTIIFIVLKLCKVINWSWIWVLCPIWIEILFWIAVVVIWYIVKKISNHRKNKSGRIKW